MSETKYELDDDEVFYFPFNAIRQSDGTFDRVWDAVDFATFYSLFIGNGIYPNPSDNLQVIANNNMTVTVKKGTAMILGHGYKQDIPIIKNIDTASPSLRRIDDIIVRLDFVERLIAVVHRKGTAGANPVVPSLIRNDDMFELRLAEISINAGVTAITQASIKDTRLDNSVCGIVSQMVLSVDTTTIFNQYQDYLNRKIAEWNKIMEEQQKNYDEHINNMKAWYNNIKHNISRLQSFHFDNLAELPWSKRTTTFNSDGNIYELITNLTITSLKIAERTTIFLTNGNIKERINIFNEDGTKILKWAEIETIFGENIIENTKGEGFNYIPNGSVIIGNLSLDINDETASFWAVNEEEDIQ